MILLEGTNRICQELFHAHIIDDNRANVDVTIADFDACTFHIHTDAENKSVIVISMRMAGAKECMKYGGEEMLKETYGDMLAEKPEDGFDVTLNVDCDKYSGDEGEKVVEKVATMKKRLLGAPMEFVFSGKKAEEDVIIIPYRGDEMFFLKPEPKQVTMVFNVLFKDADDVVLAKVFLQEFQDARRRIQSAPAVTYSKEVPKELEGLKQVKEMENQGFVSFVLFDRHWAIGQRDATISLLQTFRNYLHYHIKCSKAYMHTRMRARVELLLKVLNRAKPEPLQKKEKKTASGRTFKRA